MNNVRYERDRYHIKMDALIVNIPYSPMPLSHDEYMNI